MNPFFTALVILLTTISHASFFDFDQDISCTSKDGAGFEIKYDKSKYPEYGRKGEIQMKIKTSGVLSVIAENLNASDPDRRTLQLNGAAGMAGNFLHQDKEDPFVAKAVVTFRSWDLLNPDGSFDRYVKNFIGTIKTYKVHAYGYHELDSRPTMREFLQVEIRGGLDGFGTYLVQFLPEDCQLN